MTGIDRFEFTKGAVDGAADAGCSSHRDCIRQVGTDGDAAVYSPPAICRASDHTCVEIETSDCRLVTGDYLDDHAILVGSLFATLGGQSAINGARERAVQLAFEQVDGLGGIAPATGTSALRPLVLVACDTAGDPERAARHLTTDLACPVVIGPNASQDVLEVAQKVTIPAGAAMVSPTAIASSVGALLDDDLVWSMAPSDEQRGPLMLAQIAALEAQHRTQFPTEWVRLSVIYRDDALGVGTRTSINALQLNGRGLLDPINLGNHVLITPYDETTTQRDSLVIQHLAFQPDIVIVAGSADAITDVLVPLERGWQSEANYREPAKRPTYLLVEALKTPELLEAVTGNDELRGRIRGASLAAGVKTPDLFEAFAVDYQVRFPKTPPTVAGAASSFDAAYAVAFALALTRSEPPSGHSIGRGLRAFAPLPSDLAAQGDPASLFRVQSTQVVSSFARLLPGTSPVVLGSSGPLSFDRTGTITQASLEVWCIGAPNGNPSFQSSGLMYDVTAGTWSGEYTPCSP